MSVVLKFAISVLQTRWLLMLLFVLLIGLPSNAHAAQQPGLVRVGVFESPPFLIKTESGWDGIAFHLWREVASDLDLEYVLIEFPSGDYLNAVEAGLIDVVLVADATADDEARLDFTHSYYITPMGVAVTGQQTLWDIAKAVLSPQFLQICIWLGIAFTVIGVLIWLFERRQNEAMFGGSPIEGIWSGFWWAGVTMTAVGYGDKTPKTVAGRILALLWMLVALGVTATLTATITSVLTVGAGLQQNSFPQMLREMTVGSVTNSVSTRFLEQERIKFQAFTSLDEGWQALQAGELDALVHSAAALRFLKNEKGSQTLSIRKTEQNPQRFAFGLPDGHRLREEINRSLLRRTRDSGWQAVTRRYMAE